MEIFKKITTILLIIVIVAGLGVAFFLDATTKVPTENVTTYFDVIEEKRNNEYRLVCKGTILLSYQNKKYAIDIPKNVKSVEYYLDSYSADKYVKFDDIYIELIDKDDVRTYAAEKLFRNKDFKLVAYSDNKEKIKKGGIYRCNTYAKEIAASIREVAEVSCDGCYYRSQKYSDEIEYIYGVTCNGAYDFIDSVNEFHSESDKKKGL